METEAKEIRVRANAKINLFLEVTGRRQDGYHELETVMQTVSLSDEVTVRCDSDKEGIVLTSNKRYIPCDMTNVAAKCAQRFIEETGIKGGITIHIDKKIPVAAGLGGGSADGAAVLRALNDLTGRPLDREKLCALGAKAGADVPFCVIGGCALATGIGDIFTPLPVIKNVWAVIAIGSRGSSTPVAYKALDDAGYTATRSVRPMIDAIRAGSASGVAGQMYNAFESVVLEENKDARRLREKLAESGAEGVLLSGSGAAVYGVFDDRKAARAVCENLRKDGYFAVVSSFIGRTEG